MIDRIPGTKNGFKLRDDTTNEDIQRIRKGYPRVKCIIVNGYMYKYFKPGITEDNIITVNNKVGKNELYINKFN